MTNISKIKIFLNLDIFSSKQYLGKCGEDAFSVEDSINFAKLISKNYSVEIISTTAEERLNKNIKELGIFEDEKFINILKNEKEIIEFLKLQNKFTNWVMYFCNCEKITRIDSTIVIMPINFYGKLAQFESKSFTEHAKDKLLYNQLSKYYMQSIANDTEKEVDFLVNSYNLFVKNESRKIIDCCCGIGRHDYLLAEKGYYITGIDISDSQIKTAKKVHNNANIKYIVGDVRNFELIEKKFDMAICMWTTYNYLSQEVDCRNFIKNVFKHLNNNGILILDSKNIPALDSRRMYKRERKTSDFSVELLVYKRIISNIQNSQYFYFIEEGESKSFYFDEEFIRFYYLNELEKIVHPYFEIIKCYGDFDANEYEIDKSERFILVLKKCQEI